MGELHSAYHLEKRLVRESRSTCYENGERCDCTRAAHGNLLPAESEVLASSIAASQGLAPRRLRRSDRLCFGTPASDVRADHRHEDLSDRIAHPHSHHRRIPGGSRPHDRRFQQQTDKGRTKRPPDGNLRPAAERADSQRMPRSPYARRRNRQQR